MANVVNMHNQEIPILGEPRRDVVEKLEHLLSLAKAGEMCAVGAVWIDAAGAGRMGVAGCTEHPNGLAGWGARLAKRLVEHAEDME